jgi:hypothetical protein
MDEKVAFQVIKNVIIKQNEVFLRDLAVRFNRDPDDFCKKYIKPEYYLPIIQRTIAPDKHNS